LAAAPKDSPLAGLDFRYPLAIDTHAFRAACDWREPTPLNEALASTIADEEQRG